MYFLSTSCKTGAGGDQDESAASQHNFEDDHEETNEGAQHPDGGGAGCSRGIFDSLLHDFTDSTLMAHQDSAHQFSSRVEVPDEENLDADDSIPVSSMNHSDVEEALWKTLTFEKVCCNLFFKLFLNHH